MITSERIKDVKDDEDLYEIISSEMSNLMQDINFSDKKEYVKAIQSLPKLYWALGAIYDLDVSLALDDLGWHFGNHYSLELANETLKALKEIGADEEYEIFSEALEIVKKYWAELGDALKPENIENFPDWYANSELEKRLEELNRRMWKIVPERRSLLSYITNYARAHPESAAK
jgi:Rad3-related DNA helicase